MSADNPPKKRLAISPGESPWLAMAKELADNPDSPISLRIMSSVTHAMAPRRRAADQVVSALEVELEHQGQKESAAVKAAIGCWEREFKEPMTSAMLKNLEVEAKERIEQRRRQPPPMVSILSSVPVSTDVGYDHGIHLEGLKGTWHRLWGLLSLVHTFGDDIDRDGGVADVRQQFQRQLGRDMSDQEWKALAAHAAHHAETVMKPIQNKLQGGRSE